MTDLPPPPGHPPPAFLVSSEPTPPPRSRGPVIALAVIGAAIVICLAVAVPMFLTEDPTPADLSAVRAYDDLALDHTAEDVNYPQSPAVGGPHDPTWLDCGVYDEPVREENAVHDLEHGAVWISYDPDLNRGDVETLAEQLPQNGILAPYPGLPVPVVVTVWGRQLELEAADDARLPLFIRRYGGGETAPEPFASCAGGVRDPEGGPADEPGTSV
ncbi:MULTISPECIES: DUF3105 domain-containing protein [unclassified Nocardioides]|uniref:DUF3105 domain-containing protein n=1 Tax=unclassified Nocardioides TaxID=2615069 RepID=UPI003605B581